MDIYKPIVETINEMVSDIPGWSPEDQLYTLYLLGITTAKLGGDILEIGSWCGRSSTVLALAAKNSGIGKIHCVDLFPSLDDWFENQDGTYSFKVRIGERIYGGYSNQTVWKEPYEQQIIPMYERYGSNLQAIFQNTVERKGFSKIITDYKGTTYEFASEYNGKLRLAFIDGDHGYRAVCEDIQIVEKCLQPGGWIVFDDAFSVYEGVNQAIIDKIISSGRYELAGQFTRKCFGARRKNND